MIRLLLSVLILLGCNGPNREPAPDAADSTPVATADPVVKTGAQVLVGRGFDILRGKRVGLIVNHTAMVDSLHLIDVIDEAEDVELAALFGPEHGIRGTADAGAKIEHGKDTKTGVPIYSLYGQTRKPTAEMLEDVDVLVFDIQDVGSRFYTYISTMGLAMQAAAEHGVKFVVLDRPNPLGGELVAGFDREPEYESFVGQYQIPMVHGLTIGELARMIKGEGLMDGLENLELEVVPMQGWRRDLVWPETGLAWTPPSPNIPDFETALVYPGSVLFEATSASEGRGTRAPFLQVGAPWADGAALARTLNEAALPGVRFEAVEFTPVGIEGMSSDPKLKGRLLQGVRYLLTDISTFRPVDAGIHLLHTFYHQAREKGVSDLISRTEWLARLSGTDRLMEMLEAGRSPAEIIAVWQPEVEAFRNRRTPYLLYSNR